ncbi:MAG TPA: hypothetical protein VG322_10315 [Candidatus Acidoferrales bacterium]|nr:hypothetical protein [Candidatus Acidoferrales bacterium]
MIAGSETSGVGCCPIVVIALVGAGLGLQSSATARMLVPPKWQSQRIQGPRDWVYGVAFIAGTNNL